MSRNLPPIPDRMKHLAIDPRGYPIPANVQVGRDGKAEFALNDASKSQILFEEDRCSICGGKLLRGRCSVGGAGSVFHPQGAFIDPPMHYECARYAIQVCPFLAAPSYSKSTAQLPPQEVGVVKGALAVNRTVFNNRPDPFILIMYTKQKNNINRFGIVQSFHPKQPYLKIEYWRHGVQLSDEEGKALADSYFKQHEELWNTQRDAR